MTRACPRVIGVMFAPRSHGSFAVLTLSVNVLSSSDDESLAGESGRWSAEHVRRFWRFVLIGRSSEPAWRPSWFRKDGRLVLSAEGALPLRRFRLRLGS
jgi:hypothetical protein